MNAVNLEYSNYSSKVVWGIIVAGTAVGLGLEVLLNFLGVGLGLSQFNLSANVLFRTGVGAVIWLALSGCISMFFAGWVMSKVSNIACAKTRAVHAILVWCFATLITVFITATASSAMMGGPLNIVKDSVASVAAQRATTDKALGNANNVVDNITDNLQSNQEDVQKAVDKTTDNLGRAAMIMFVAFLLSMITTILGAVLAKPKDAEQCMKDGGIRTS